MVFCVCVVFRNTTLSKFFSVRKTPRSNSVETIFSSVEHSRIELFFLGRNFFSVKKLFRRTRSKCSSWLNKVEKYTAWVESDETYRALVETVETYHFLVESVET